jgi:predicted SprT family Zn-dependent metalloprotease
LGIREPYKKEVQLSSHFLSQNLGEGKGREWDEVIRHELAHAVDVELRGKSGHDKHWKAVANAMLSTGVRTFSKEQLSDETQSKYTLVCNSCGKETKKHKRPSRLHACGTCCKVHNGGKFTTDFVMRVRQNY